MASGTGLFDQAACRWDAEALAAAGITTAQLFPLVDRHEPRRGLRGAWARRWPRLRSVPWFPAVGDGVAASRRIGSEVHDAIYFDDERRYHRATNRAGGLEGGVTNGQDVVVRAFMKPISTLRRGLPSVDIESREAHRSQWERSDVTAVPACGVVCEAMLAIVLAAAMREKFGGDSLNEMRRNYDAYLAQLQRF